MAAGRISRAEAVRDSLKNQARMLFHSQEFLLLFLPCALLGWYACAGSRRGRNAWMILASWIFYAYWDIRLLPLLVVSVAVNWLLAEWALRHRVRWAVAAGIVLNLAVLGTFKYADFFADTLAWSVGAERTPWSIILPLGISFFTFQQISYLADIARGKAAGYRFDEYALYVSFFPQLIAGPIVRHDELIPQLDRDPRRPGWAHRVSIGLVLLLIGVAKKTVFAQQFAAMADPVFATDFAQSGLGAADAWTGVTAFGLQIYYDFSGYSDMAIGLALLAGIRLPVNFDAPYRAVSLVDFWRRWHMTLSRFLRDYLYIPLGGGQAGPARQVLALVVTMFLGGLWHGAAWSFVLWGLLHGAGLAVVHLWRRLGIGLPNAVAWALTITFVFLAWVLFRAESVSDAAAIWTAMAGAAAEGAASAPPGDLARDWVWLGVGLALAVLGPTSQVLAYETLRPHRWAAVLGGVAMAALVLHVGTGGNQEFIYFQF